MAKKLFVGNLSWDTNDASLSELFSKAGTVVSANVIMDKYSGRSKGFGFVEMSSDEEADKAKQELNGQTLDGRQIAVSEARPFQPRDNNQRGFGGGGRDNGRDRRTNRPKY
ncbi:MAG: hypothetical protein A2958_02955 [Candidatus Levybacteria bacterium RIFCSPLOWO2_01_FULL_38_13]|nr:MAG: hypothetical protein A2629_03370 [Candidatus Levybacteria bacterium RIFCSPHIGHO2_01_FULL_41_15]OGH35287.1 MAG: hypothetical protein A2958_02955 [Candidatus Levybacteria bacterium RIFCSPLOWO2_01_FULL_38_13]